MSTFPCLKYNHLFNDYDRNAKRPGIIFYGKLLNFNSGNIIFTLTTTLISFLYTFLIYYVFKSKFKELSLYTIIFLSLLILSSPYFRGSAYWGLTENTGYIFLGFAKGLSG